MSVCVEGGGRGADAGAVGRPGSLREQMNGEVQEHSYNNFRCQMI